MVHLNLKETHGYYGKKNPAAAQTDFAYNIIDRFKYSKRVAAQCIPLDIPSMRLDNKAKWEIANMPLNRIKFLC